MIDVVADVVQIVGGEIRAHWLSRNMNVGSLFRSGQYLHRETLIAGGYAQGITAQIRCEWRGDKAAL
jgi:hypothetical protein